MKKITIMMLFACTLVVGANFKNSSFFLLAVAEHATQPTLFSTANDNCSTARHIFSLPYTGIQSDGINASYDGFVSTCTDDEMNDGLWYQVDGTGSNIVITVTSQAGYDHQIGVYSGNCGNLICNGTVDNASAGEEENFTIANSVVGTTYFINVGHYSGSVDQPEGNFTISITGPLTVPANDNCSGATEITAMPYTYSQNNAAGATADGFVFTCAADGMNDGLWYRVTGNGNNILISATPTSSNDDLQLGVYSGSCGSLICEGTVDEGFGGDQESFEIRNSIPGTVYYINAGHYGGSTDAPEMNFTINVTSSPPVPVPSNDNCSGAIAIASMPFSYSQTDGRGATADGFVTACTNKEMNDGLWFSVEGNGNNLEISVVPDVDYDVAIGIFTGSCNAFSCYESVDRGSQGGEESIVIRRSQIGTVYYINVGNYSGYDDEEENNFSINVTSTVPPAMAECAPEAISPLDGATDVAIGNTIFSWEVPAAGGPIDSYDLYRGTTTPLDEDDYIGNYTTNTATLQLYGYSTLNYWKAVAKNAGGEAVGCTEWTFTTVEAPPVPTNDTCEGAAVVTSFPFNNAIDASSSTNNSGFITACSNATNDGIWYVVNGNGTDITINATSEMWDGELGVYTGSCGNFTCYDVSDNGISGDTETITITNSVVGTAYYINFGHYSDNTDNSEGLARIELLSNGLSTADSQLKNFKAYPNPVHDILNLATVEAIATVSVFNVMGQELISKMPDTAESTIDFSNLPSGTYFVKVTSGDASKTLKIIKQ